MLFPFGAVEITAGLILCFAAGYEAHEHPGTTSAIRLVGAVSMLTAAIVHHLWVFPLARRLRQEIGDFDGLPEGDPRRGRFGRLHALSSALALLTLALGLGLILHGAVANAP
jgi:hypothetical protein